jgi:hypothetical protein
MSDECELVKFRAPSDLSIGFYSARISQAVLEKTNFKIAAESKISEFSARDAEYRSNGRS